MKIVLVNVLLCVLLIAGPVHAGFSAQTGDGELYELFNALFYAKEDPRSMNSNLDLMNSEYFLPNGTDTVFGDAGDTLRIDLTFRDSGWGGELGIWNGTHDPGDSGYETIVQKSEIIEGAFARQDSVFTMKDAYTFADTKIERGIPVNRWSADPKLNLLAQDQFLAFSIDNDALLSRFNEQFFGNETDKYYSADLDDVWMIGFEEHSWDGDYNDLVAIVSRPSELNEVPIPCAALLMASGLLLAFGRNRFGRFA